MIKKYFFITLIFLDFSCSDPIIETISISPVPHIEKADFHIWKPIAEPKAVLILIPGRNGNGEKWITTEWKDLATKNHWAIIGVHFETKENLLLTRQGYYFVEQNSGKMLLQAIDQAFPNSPQLVMYGFSAGCHFITRFIEKFPKRVLCWSAGGAGEFPSLENISNAPPGIIFAGDKDSYPLGSCLQYFTSARSKDRKLAWVELKNTGHQSNPSIENLSRLYFEAFFNNPQGKGIWKDLASTTYSPPFNVRETQCWFPSENVAKTWDLIQK